MRKLISLLLLIAFRAYGQGTTQITVASRSTREPLPYVSIGEGTAFLANTDSLGHATFTVGAGDHKLIFALTGYRQLDTMLTFPLPANTVIYLDGLENALNEVTIVSSTRTENAIENSALKVEVLGPEEIREEVGIKPGNIASILGDVSGVQIQQSSATTGNSNVRIQGLPGRYTQILRDGMPLYDGFSGGLGILTIPPLDLKQIELVKGAASTLYGGGAIGGLINLVSNRPKINQELDVLANYTTLKELNLNTYAARRYKKWGYTFMGGFTSQQAVDVNRDGLSDVPNISSALLHPRLYYYPNDRTTISLGYSGTFDNRKGGDMTVLRDGATGIHQYYEASISVRHTGEYLIEHKLHNNLRLTLKGVASDFLRLIQTNYYDVKGRQTSYFTEVSLYIPLKKNNLVTGLNVTGDDYRTIAPATILLRSFTNQTFGAFGQYQANFGKRAVVEAGLRTDIHNKYGLFVLPRLAALYKIDEQWGLRAGFGMGYKTPNPLSQQNTDYSVLQLLPLPDGLKAERSYGYNTEVNYKSNINDNADIFINQAFFLTTIADPLTYEAQLQGVVLRNQSSPIVSKGFDTYVKLRLKDWELYMGYTYTDAQNTYLATNKFIPLTPRNRAAMVLAREFKEKFRGGIEASYTGAQYRYDGTATPDYVFLAAMVQYNPYKHIMLVLNCENLLDYRMSRVETLYTGPITNPLFKPLWAPIDGRVVNVSVRWKL